MKEDDDTGGVPRVYCALRHIDRFCKSAVNPSPQRIIPALMSASSAALLTQELKILIIRPECS